MSIGIDITEVKRIEEMAEKYEGFLKRIFTPGEIKFCEKKRNKFQHYASRFAAKESVLKAIATEWNSYVGWKDIEILNDPSGRPRVNTYGTVKKILKEQKIKEILVSLSHTKKYAISMAFAKSENS